MRRRVTVRCFWGRKKMRKNKKRRRRRRRSRREKRQKNRRKRKRVKPDWECLPRVLLVTLNYKWSLTFQAKTHNHNIIPMMQFHWQATLLSPGLALATNLRPLLSFCSIPVALSFQSLEWGILQTLPSFALSIFLSLVSESLYCVTVSCNLLRNSLFPPFSPLLQSLSPALWKENIPSTIPELFPCSAVPVSLAASFSHFVLFHIMLLPLSSFLSFFPVRSLFLAKRSTDLTYFSSWSEVFISSCSVRDQDAQQIELSSSKKVWLQQRTACDCISKYWGAWFHSLSANQMLVLVWENLLVGRLRT